MYFDIIVRYCGSVGWLGILMVNDKEVYRTGKHQTSAAKSLEAVEQYIAKKYKNKEINDDL